MSKGFILNKYSEKVGEFDNANFDSIGVWNLSHVRVNQDHIDIVKMSTKEPYLFLLVEERGADSFDVSYLSAAAFFILLPQIQYLDALNHFHKL